MKKLTVGEILRQNPQLDMARVDEMVAFCEAATKSGIDVDPVYRVSPPLGDLVRPASQRHVFTPQKR